MQAVKGKTSHHLLSEYRRLKREFWGRHLWARGYFVCSSGNVTDEMTAALDARVQLSHCALHSRVKLPLPAKAFSNAQRTVVAYTNTEPHLCFLRVSSRLAVLKQSSGGNYRGITIAVDRHSRVPILEENGRIMITSVSPQQICHQINFAKGKQQECNVYCGRTWSAFDVPDDRAERGAVELSYEPVHCRTARYACAANEHGDIQGHGEVISEPYKAEFVFTEADICQGVCIPRRCTEGGHVVEDILFRSHRWSVSFGDTWGVMRGVYEGLVRGSG